jgi:hypothetical protein
MPGANRKPPRPSPSPGGAGKGEPPGSEREQFHALQNSLAALQLWTHELLATKACPDCAARQQLSIDAIARLVTESINRSQALEVSTKDPSSSARKAGRGARRTK